MKTRFNFQIPRKMSRNTPLKSLPIAIEGTFVEKCITRLRTEILNKQLNKLKIQFYISDEWFTPDQSTSIAIPFHILCKDLQQFHILHGLEIEGHTPITCMKLLRHEAGHCFVHAYNLTNLSKFKKIFGDPKKPYDVDNYKVNRSSRSFVKHLKDHYAQSHPEEDFAETFAVWLNPKSNWQIRYQNQKTVLRKFQFIEELVATFATQTPLTSSRSRMGNIRTQKTTLKHYYQHRLHE